MTRKLLSLPASTANDLPKVNIQHYSIEGSNSNGEKDPYGDNLLTRKDLKRAIVLMSRIHDHPRALVNEKMIVSLLQKYLSPEYELYVAGHTDAFHSIEKLQASWRRYAAIYSRSKVILGPHGGAVNNIMWAPSDAHFIEFNDFPSNTSILPRSIFNYAANAKGLKHWTIPASVCSAGEGNFYYDRIRIAPQELFAALQRIGVLKSSFRLSFVPV